MNARRVEAVRHAAVVEVQAGERPQRAVRGLRTGVDLDVGSHLGVPVRGRAVERRVRTEEDWLVGAVALTVPEVVSDDVAADADTNVGARDVVEPVTVESSFIPSFLEIKE